MCFHRSVLLEIDLKLDYSQNIQWFPGHMTKAFRLIEKEIKNVDIVAELLDARIPKSSKNPELARLIYNIPHLLILNKEDLADPEKTAQWSSYYEDMGYFSISLDSRKKQSLNFLIKQITSIFSDKPSKSNEVTARYKPRVMVVGVPNVGKSTLINSIKGYRVAKVEDRPGITRGKQWVSTPALDLMDIPGVLWPKFEDAKIANNLAFTGSVSDKTLDILTLSLALIDEIKKDYKIKINERYKIDVTPSDNAVDVITMIAKSRGMIIKGGEPDLERAAHALLDDLRKGALGRITFEIPESEDINDK